jgi:putative two-component system response regulator
MKKSILIVDDEPDVLEAVSTLVRHEGYDVMLANSGERAIEILARRSFDLIMTDLSMPGITGWQLLEAAKKQYPDIKVVVFTGYVDEQGESILIDRNADGFLVKPIDVPKMQALLSSLLGDDEVIGANIIAVDDESVTLTMVEGVLGANGMAVKGFQNPQKALKYATKKPPHLFLVDIEMPTMSGFEFYIQARRVDTLTSIPVIILTGHSDREIVMEALDLGVQGFIIKPFDPDDLVGKVRKAIAGAHRAKI